MLFLGRHVGYPVALEGALKLKELAYMHAEGFAAGELKHGPIALIDEDLPVVVVVPSPRGRSVLHDKIVSNIQEIRAMGADVGEGHITAAPYFQGIENEENRRFLSRWKKIYGDDYAANMCSEAAYFQVHLFAQALSKTNSLETEHMRAAVLGENVAAPQGQVSINPGCGHANLWTRIGRANRSGQFDIVKQSNTAVNADPYLIGYGRHFAFS